MTRTPLRDTIKCTLISSTQTPGISTLERRTLLWKTAACDKDALRSARPPQMRRVRSETDFSAPVPAGPRTPSAGAGVATAGGSYFPLHIPRAGPVRQWAIAQAVVPREGMGSRHGASDEDLARPNSDARRGDGRTHARRGSQGESTLHIGSRMRRAHSFQSLSSGIDSPRDRFVRRPEIEQGSDFAGPGYGARQPDSASLASGARWMRKDGGSDIDDESALRTCRPPQPPASWPAVSTMRRAHSLQSLSDVRSAQDRFVRRPEIIEQGSGSGPPTPAPGPKTRRVPLGPAQRSPGTPVRVQDQDTGKVRAARHQHESSQHNINRLLADWCAQERERMLKEGGKRHASDNVVHTSTSVAAVCDTKSRFSVVVMLLSTLWMSLTSLGSWVHLVQSVTGLTRTIAQLVPGTRAGNARSPQAELDRRKEELREAERVVAKARRAVQEAEVRVGTLSAGLAS